MERKKKTAARSLAAALLVLVLCAGSSCGHGPGTETNPDSIAETAQTAQTAENGATETDGAGKDPGEAEGPGADAVSEAPKEHEKEAEEAVPAMEFTSVYPKGIEAKSVIRVTEPGSVIRTTDFACIPLG